MITNALIIKASELCALEEELRDEIEARAVLIANRMGLDEMFFLPLLGRSTYKRGGKEVESKQLDELDAFRAEYCSCGYSQLWTKEKGWT